jgi:hypothetical protein
MRFAPLNGGKEAAQLISGVYIAIDHRHGRVGQCLILIHWLALSMVPGYVQGGTRAVPGHDRREEGANTLLHYFEYLYCIRVGQGLRWGIHPIPPLKALMLPWKS